MLPPQEGFLFLDKAKFAASYAAEVDPEKTAFWADSQVPYSASNGPSLCGTNTGQPKPRRSREVALRRMNSGQRLEPTTRVELVTCRLRIIARFQRCNG
jgi:hypothetical protein